jgi:hypothetical protein
MIDSTNFLTIRAARQGERPPVPLPDQNKRSPKGPLPRTPRWSPSVLLMRGLIV